MVSSSSTLQIVNVELDVISTFHRLIQIICPIIKRTFWSAGADWIISVIKTGSSSCTLWTPAANVPSWAALFIGCPASFALSAHFRVTESTTYRTPSLWVGGAFLKCVYNFWISTDSDYGENMLAQIWDTSRMPSMSATLTWTLLTQRVVMLWMREPDTPGGFINSMACRPASRSATADMTN